MSEVVEITGLPRPVAPARAARLPFGMESSAGSVLEGDDAQTALMRELNFFPTPPWAARAGGELIRRLDTNANRIWEPACGAGHMAGPLKESFAVWASDVHDHGCRPAAVVDFLTIDAALAPQNIDWVITNPPFAKAEAFVVQGLTHARRGVAMLCRLAFVESIGRYPLMRQLAVMAPFCERVPMQLGSWNPDLSSATAYAWFIWMHPCALAESPLGSEILAANRQGGGLVLPVPPGTCARLTRAADRSVYAGEQPSPQLELLGAR